MPAKTKIRRDVDPKTVKSFAREFADYRLGGCPGFGFWDGFKARLAKVARSHGVGFSELFAVVHQQAYEIIDVEIKIAR